MPLFVWSHLLARRICHRIFIISRALSLCLSPRSLHLNVQAKRAISERASRNSKNKTQWDNGSIFSNPKKQNPALLLLRSKASDCIFPHHHHSACCSKLSYEWLYDFIMACLVLSCSLYTRSVFFFVCRWCSELIITNNSSVPVPKHTGLSILSACACCALFSLRKKKAKTTS